MRLVWQNTPKVVQFLLLGLMIISVLFFSLFQMRRNRLNQVENSAQATSTAAQEAIIKAENNADTEVNNFATQIVATSQAIAAEATSGISEVQARATAAVATIQSSAENEIQQTTNSANADVSNLEEEIEYLKNELPWNHPEVNKLLCEKIVDQDRPIIQTFDNDCDLNGINLIGYTIPLGKKINPETENLIVQTWLFKDENRCIGSSSPKSKIVGLNFVDPNGDFLVLPPIYEDPANILNSDILKFNQDPRNRDPEGRLGNDGPTNIFNPFYLESLTVEDRNKIRGLFFSFQVPNETGKYVGCYQMQTLEGDFFGPILPVAIEVSQN